MYDISNVQRKHITADQAEQPLESSLPLLLSHCPILLSQRKEFTLQEGWSGNCLCLISDFTGGSSCPPPPLLNSRKYIFHMHLRVPRRVLDTVTAYKGQGLPPHSGWGQLSQDVLITGFIYIAASRCPGRRT